MGVHPLGETHWGVDTLTGKRVLLTFYRTAASGEALEACRNSARIAGGLGSTYIPRFVDAARMGDRTVIAVDPGDVEIKLLPRQQAIEPGRAVAIVRQLCKAIGAAHDVGLVHRALTLGSILLTDRGRPDAVSVGDFGSAAFLEQIAVDDADAPYQPISPDRALGLRASPREDIYLLGCIAYTLMSGLPPFRTGNADALRRRHAIEEPTSLDARTKDGARVPPPLVHVVMRCLAKEADERFSSVHDLEAELCMAQIESDIPSGWDDLPLPEVEPERRRGIADGLADLSTRIAAPEQVAHAREAARAETAPPVAEEELVDAELTESSPDEAAPDPAQIPTKVTETPLPPEDEAIAAVDDDEMELETVVRLVPESKPEPAPEPMPPIAAKMEAPKAPTPAPVPAPMVAPSPAVPESRSSESMAPSLSTSTSMSEISGPSSWPKIIVGLLLVGAIAGGVVMATASKEETPTPPPTPPAEPVKPPPPKPEPTIARRQPKPLPEPTTKAQHEAVALAVKAAATRDAGKLPEAEKLFRKALTKDPQNLGALVAIADLCQAKGDRACTIEFLRRANKAYADDAVLHMRLGDALLEAEKLVEARVHFEEALALGDQAASQRLAAISTRERK